MSAVSDDCSLVFSVAATDCCDAADCFGVAALALYGCVEDATAAPAAPAAAGSHGDWAMLRGSMCSGSGSINEEEAVAFGAIGITRGVVSREDAI